MRLRHLALALPLLLAGCPPESCAPAPPAMSISNIVRGGQAEIDQGYVVLMYRWCWPGEGCPVWLAGHRTTHGSVFAQVAGLQVGDTVIVAHSGVSYTYVVTGHTVICCTGDRFTPTADLTLQTSASGASVHIVTARQT